MDECSPRRPRKGIAAAGLLLGFLLVAPASALADADLALDFHGTQQTWYPGGSLYYQAIVSSAGPSSTTAAVTVNLPAAATAFNPANAPCSGSTTVTCDLGEIDPGSGALIGIYVDAPAPGRYAASAHVAGADPDPDDTNNGRTVTSDVIETRPSVGIRSVSGPTTVTVGGKATYRIDLHNYRPRT